MALQARMGRGHGNHAAVLRYWKVMGAVDFGAFGGRCVPGTQISCVVFDANQELSRYVAEAVAAVIRERNGAGRRAVLGLPTGSTPVGVYRELIRMHREERLDF